MKPEDAISIESLLRTLNERGIRLSERSLREKAMRTGAYRRAGRTMFFLPEHLDVIFAPEPPRDPRLTLAGQGTRLGDRGAKERVLARLRGRIPPKNSDKRGR